MDEINGINKESLSMQHTQRPFAHVEGLEKAVHASGSKQVWEIRPAAQTTYSVGDQIGIATLIVMLTLLVCVVCPFWLAFKLPHNLWHSEH